MIQQAGDKDVSDEAARTLDHPSPHLDGCLGIVLKKGSGLQPCFAFLTIPPKPSCICSSKLGWNTAKLPSLFSLGAESWYISETADKTGPVNTYNFYIQEHSRACSALLLYCRKRKQKKKQGVLLFLWVFFLKQIIKDYDARPEKAGFEGYSLAGVSSGETRKHMLSCSY